MAISARKITFQEAWDTTTIFFVDEALESEIDTAVENLLEVAKDTRIAQDSQVDEATIAAFLQEHEKALEVVLKDIELSEEKFMRIISLLRKLGRISGGFSAHDAEWGMAKIKSKIQYEADFAHLVAQLLVNGKQDTELASYIPRYYLETLNYREILGSSLAARRVRFKRSLIGTYGGRKGYKVEERIRLKLEQIGTQYNIALSKGRSRMTETDIDFVIPSLEDPWIIIMSSFQETTSSGQTTKARDMFNAYERINHSNSRYNENRAFVNFVDGGGWLVLCQSCFDG